MSSPSREDQFTKTREAAVGERRALAYRRCRITVTSGPNAGRVLETEKDLIRIGSVTDNDLVIQDPAVSRYHLEVKKQKGEYIIVDNNSTNGTFVGALRVKEATIRHRGEIHVGDSSLLFEPIDTEFVVEPSGAERCDDLVGRSLPMREIYTVIERVAPTELTILVTGETGTGKELVARALHKKSRRQGGPFVTLDCSALPPTLIESALFGHEKGAFTGADQAYAGVFERADGGTLFLDELGELPLELQPKLLRALERGEIQRLRGDKTIRVNVRVIGATNRDLHKMVQESRFRGDLYYRLAVIRIQIPALREREEDFPLIVEEFFRRYGNELEATGAKAKRIGAGALAALERYNWPGNVRELMNVLRRAAVFAGGEEITMGELPEEITGNKAPIRARTPSSSMSMPDASVPFKDAKAKVLDAFERQYLQDLLLRHKQNISKAAREAGIDRRHLYRLLDKYEIEVKDRELEDWSPRIAPESLRSVAVVYEDDRWVAVSKPAGMAVHGGAGETGRTLIDLISECYGGKVDVHLAHRIDKETSGLVVLAKSKAEAQALQAVWDQVDKRYLAVALGKIAGPMQLDRPLPEKDGRPQSALTRIRPLELWSRIEPVVTLVEAEIVTGRTHQIRRHLAGAGHPVLMDDKHGQFKANKAWARALRDQLDVRVKHLCLHSWRAVLPRSEGNKLILEAPWPAALTAIAEALRVDSTPPERPA